MVQIPDPLAAAARPISRGTGPDAPATELAGASPGLLHGRMLQVSRLATIGEMAAGIAHELNQPLTAIANYAQACERLLKRPGARLEDIGEALREISGQAVRAGDIIRRLRSLAASEPARRQKADINSTIDQIRDLIEADARAHLATVTFQLGTGLPRVFIDAAQIQHAIFNLVRNAVEAPRADDGAARQVRLETSRIEGDVEVAVCDNGLGLREDALERMFDPFFSTKASGTGLGLPISHSLVRAHGGVLGHRPNSPQGACFYIRLAAEEAGDDRGPRAGAGGATV